MIEKVREMLLVEAGRLSEMGLCPGDAKQISSKSTEELYLLVHNTTWNTAWSKAYAMGKKHGANLSENEE